MSTGTWREQVRRSALVKVPGTTMERWGLLALLVLAATLRLWNLPGIPYTHDEISALVRLRPGFLDALRNVVVEIDAHPPGVQLFEWAWTRMFGMGEAAVKLPFILMSVAALFLLYRFAFAWCGGTVALVTMAILAVLQYTVMYGQIARPYAAGFFTTALLADQLTRYLGSGSRRALAGMALAAVLSAYTHHFSLLLAAIMAVTGLFLVRAESRKAYLVASGVAVLAYLPNVPNFFRQLDVKGLTAWLAPPTVHWLPDYLWWIAHCSVVFAGALSLLLLTSAALRIRNRGSVGPLWAISLAWGILPLAIGYAYSVWRAPVLQYSVVLFSFPYMLIGALAGLRHLRPGWALLVAGTVAALGAGTLITVRKHYEIFYRSRYELAAQGIIAASSVPGRMALYDGPGEVIGFYLDLWKVDKAKLSYAELRGMPVERLDSLLHASSASEVFLGATAGAEPERAARIQAMFPFLLERHDVEEGQTFLFGAGPSTKRLDDHAWSSRVAPDAIKGEDWSVDADLPLLQDSTGHAPRRWDFTGREFGILLEKPVYEVAKGDNDVLEVRMDATGVSGGGLKLVAELREGETTTFYRSQPCPVRMGAGTLITAIPFADLPGHGQGQRLRVYVWNEGGNPAQVASLEARVRSGNPWLYGLFQPLKGPLIYP